jgi:hypothetical protein
VFRITAEGDHESPDIPLMAPAFAYRFDAPDRSIVVSTDTPVSDALTRLARGAEVLAQSQDASSSDGISWPCDGAWPVVCAWQVY